MISRSKIEFYTIFVLVAFSINFFEANFLPKELIQYCRFLIITFGIFFSIPFVFTAKGCFVKPVIIMLISVVISIFMAHFSWDQSYFDTIKSTTPYLIWIIFFYLIGINFSINKIEKIVVFYGIIYIILFFLQFYNSDLVLFGFKEEFKIDRGVTRIDFPGGGVFYLTLFIAINRITDSCDERKGRWLILLIICLMVTVLQVTRQSIAFVCFICFFHFLTNTRFITKVAYLVIFTSAILVFLNSNSAIVEGLIETSQIEKEEQGEEYIRIVAANFFLNEYSPNNYCRVFGNGVPWGKSSYGNFETNLSDFGFYLTDVGLVAVLTLFGVMAVLSYIIIFMKSFLINLPKQFYYLKYYLWFLLATSLTSSYSYHTGFLIITIFVLYSVNKLNQEKKELNFEDTNI